MNKTIGLNMIVKNEAHIIKETLENACKHFNFSYWIICDTGSTDNTMDIIKKFFKDRNIKGELHQHKWVDFAHNRTKSLQASHNKTDYLFIHDADDLIKGNFSLPQILDKDGYYTNMTNGGLLYKRLNIINNRLKWKYVGVVHEYIKIDEKIKPSKMLIDGDYRILSRRLGNRSKEGPVKKYTKDALLLEKGFEETTDVDLKKRYAFYVGNSWNDAQQYDNAIKWYLKRIKLDGWKQEVYVSHYRLGLIYQIHKKNINKAIYHFIQTTVVDKTRVEGIYELFNIYRNDLKNVHIPMTIYLSNKKNINYNRMNKLFYREDINGIKFDYEVMFYSFHLNLNIDALKLLGNILNECKKNIKSNYNKNYFLSTLKLINNNVKYRNLIKKSGYNFLFRSIVDYYNKMDNDTNIVKETNKTLKYFRSLLR